jgi:hypothetical protein
MGSDTIIFMRSFRRLYVVVQLEGESATDNAFIVSDPIYSPHLFSRMLYVVVQLEGESATDNAFIVSDPIYCPVGRRIRN